MTKPELFAALRAATGPSRELDEMIVNVIHGFKITTAHGGASGQTFVATIKGSVYLRVPAWPIAEAINAYYETADCDALKETETQP